MIIPPVGLLSDGRNLLSFIAAYKVKKFLKTLREILFPLNFTCDICGIETFGGNLCDRCLKTVIFNDKTSCPVCGRKTVRPELCMECKDKPPVYNRAVSPLVYTQGGAQLVHKYKNGSGYLKEYFADLVVKKLSALPVPDCMVYVPMTASATRKRGYNQSQLLAKSISARTGIPVCNALEKVKKTKEQKTLSLREREENLRGSFSVIDTAAVRGKTVLLIDDVMTTGATVNEVAIRLKKAGAAEVYVAVIAAVEYNKPPQKKQ